MELIVATILTLLVTFVVPIGVYGLFTVLLKLKVPETTAKFMLSVLIQKVGTAVGFVMLFYLARGTFSDNWLQYALVWFVMFTLVEIGQAIGPNYSRKEALAGIISEAIYFPASAWIIYKILV